MKKVLILGAGLVAEPMVRYLLNYGFMVTIASPMKERADQMINQHPNGSSVDWSMDEPEILDSLVYDHDMTVSLLPYKFHSAVARVCLKHGKNLVTTSYIQSEMLLLDEEVRNKGILFLNEAGLDPGIDHMSAMKVIDGIHSRGGKVEEFYSLCGALPAPEAIDNPLGYKFSWSPKGVILASKNGAVYLKKGSKINIDPVDLFKDRFPYNLKGTGKLEVYPNRDSLSFIEIYGIPETKTMYRGTFRYPGWCETLDAMKTLNMLDDKVRDYHGVTFAGFIAELGNVKSADPRREISARLGLDEKSVPMESLDFLGFFSQEKMNCKVTSPFEITSDRMISKMMLSQEERDLVILQHIFLARYPDEKSEVIKSSMADYGTPSGNTAIARTVSLPAAIAVKLILENRIGLKGVIRPVFPEIYNPILDELKTLGIKMDEEYGLPESEMIV